MHVKKKEHQQFRNNECTIGISVSFALVQSIKSPLESSFCTSSWIRKKSML